MMWVQIELQLDQLLEDRSSEINERLTIPQYVMALAHVASLRSEDPYRKVGAAALDHDNRVIGTAYNGLAPGYDAPEGFWDDRTLCAYGVEEIYYEEAYKASDAEEIAKTYGVKLKQVESFPKAEF